MRPRLLRLPVLLAALAIGLVAVPAGAAAPPPPVRITFQQMPEAVQKTVRAETAGGRIRGLWKETEADGRLVYEVEAMVKGRTRDLNIAEDGTVLVCEQQMTLAELPASVRETVLSAAGKRKIRVIESVTKLGQLAYYEAKVGTGKAIEDITIGLDGARMPQ
jgi:hypothetical protein